MGLTDNDLVNLLNSQEHIKFFNVCKEERSKSTKLSFLAEMKRIIKSLDCPIETLQEINRLLSYIASGCSELIIGIHEIEVLEQIGVGGSSTVYLGRFVNLEVAVKKQTIGSLSGSSVVI